MRGEDGHLKRRLCLPVRKEAGSICAGVFEPLQCRWWVCSLVMHQGTEGWLLPAVRSGPHLSLFAGRKQPLPALVAALPRLIQWRLHRPRHSA